MAQFTFLVFSIFLISLATAQLNVTEIESKVVDAITKPISTIKNLTGEAKKMLGATLTSFNEAVNNSSITSENDTEPEIAARKTVAGELQASPKLRSQGIGEKCDSDAHCQDDTHCSGNLCSCKRNYIPSSTKSKCLPLALRLGDDCTEDQQCSEGLEAIIGNTVCLNFKCSCSFSHMLTNGKCVGPKVLGTNCQVDKECQVIGSICKLGLCICPGDQLPSPDNNQCIGAARTINDTCTEDEQCDSLGKAQCREGICVCKPLHHFNSTKCIPRKALGDDCDQSADCEVPEEPGKRDCVSGICQCIKGTQDEDICKGGAPSLTVGLSFLLWVAVINFLF